MTGLERCVFALSCALWVAAASSGSTELALTLRDGTGRAIDVTRATLAIVGEGRMISAPLTTRGAVLRVPLDNSWVRANWKRNPDLWRGQAQIVIEADGYETLVSSPFSLLEANGEGDAPRVEIAFPDHESIRLGEGETREVSIRTHLTEPTSVFIKTQSGAPLGNAEVLFSAYLAPVGNCGSPWALELARVRTGVDGKASVPSGDFMALLEVNRAGYTIVGAPNPLRPSETVVPVRSGKTIQVTVKNHERKDLALHLRIGAEPGAELEVYGCRSECPCSPCCEFLDTSDAEGFAAYTGLDIDVFDVLRVETYWEELLWEGASREVAAGRVLTIQLPEPEEGPWAAPEGH